VLGDVVSGLLLSLGVTKGNVHDGQPAHRLIRRARDLVAELTQVMGDTAYGGAARSSCLTTSAISAEGILHPNFAFARRDAKWPR
jgi:hypothetical protein